MKMSPRRTILSLFIILVSLLGSSLGSYQDNTVHPTNAHRSLMKGSHEHFAFMRTVTHHPNPTTSNSSRPEMIINIEDFGAKSRHNDDTEAFEKAWKEACSKGAVLLVPQKKTYYTRPIRFSGPCQYNTTFRVNGAIKAWDDKGCFKEDTAHWIVFKDVDNFRVDGGGTFNGNGIIWWKDSCKVNHKLPCKDAPTAVTFKDCKNLRLTNVRFKHAQQMHLHFDGCSNVKASDLLVRAPETSPNTDGIHVSRTEDILIKDSVIGTGDDCISIVNGSRNVRATNITCGPGHGISIGSLGAGNSEAAVSNVLVDGAILTGTANGVRIKTWQGGSGYAKNITFKNILMKNVSNPIIIDQNYCDREKPCQKQKSAVEVSDVIYDNINGTSASEVAIKFDCSESVPCSKVYVEDVVLEREGSGDVKALCNNIRFVKKGSFSPFCKEEN